MHRSCPCFSHKRYSSLFCRYSIYLRLEIPVGLRSMLGKPYWVGLLFFICVNNKALLSKVSHWPLQSRHPSSQLCLRRAANSEITGLWVCPGCPGSLPHSKPRQAAVSPGPRWAVVCSGGQCEGRIHLHSCQTCVFEHSTQPLRTSFASGGNADLNGLLKL